ncbi:MAG: hypothetical protein K6G44_14415 [Lentisphaeria bacterium]|nr:hypothetical protein [Lentisphaeria bacterium]
MTWILRKSIIATLLCVLFVCSSWADEPPKKQEADDAEEEQDELVVSADRMEMQLDGRTVELTGNVRVEDSNMSLTALKMMVYLTEAEKDAEKEGEKKKEKQDEDEAAHSNMKLQRIEADGEVVLRKLDGTESAMGDHAVYDVKDDTILMTGNCSIIQGKNTMNGDKVVYDRKKAKINIQKPRLTIQIDKKSGKNGGALGNFFSEKDEKKSDDKPKDDKSEEVKPKDDKPADIKQKDDKAVEDKPKDDKPIDVKPKEDKPVDVKPKEDKPVDVKPKEDKPADVKPNEDKKEKRGFWTW